MIHTDKKPLPSGRGSSPKIISRANHPGGDLGIYLYSPIQKKVIKMGQIEILKIFKDNIGIELTSEEIKRKYFPNMTMSSLSTCLRKLAKSGILIRKRIPNRPRMFIYTFEGEKELGYVKVLDLINPVCKIHHTRSSRFKKNKKDNKLFNDE